MSCTFPNCSSNAVTNNYCIGHAKMMGSTLIKKDTVIPKRSDKRKEEQKEYVKIVKEMLKANPNCEIKVEGCKVKATGLHHKVKRSPKTWLKKENLMRACDSCNLWVELHPIEAMAKGFTISKHAKA